jgi:hypothetical protein
MTVDTLEAAAPVVDTARPWPGLDAFTEALSPFFFGRDAEAEELFRRVRRDLVTLLFGQSGLGKTSLLQAGLFPRLRWAGFLPILIRLDYSAGALPPASQVKAAIKRAMAAADLPEATPIDAEESLWGYFHRAKRRLADYLGKEIVPVLVFDQFEEIFTQGLAGDDSRAASQSFLGELAELIENRPPEKLEQEIEANPDLVEDYLFDRQDHRILLALREDFLASLESLRGRSPSLGRNRYRLRRMTGRQGLDAILNPAPGLVAPAVAQEIIRFIGSANSEDAFGVAGPAGSAEGFEVEPSLLSLVCRELNERRIARGLDQIDADLLAGNRDDIIAGFYDRVLADQPRALRTFVEDRLLSDSGFRESITLDGARRALSDAGVPATALDQLVRHRLLRVEERLDAPRVEIIHDILTPVIRRSRDTRHLRHAEGAVAEREAALLFDEDIWEELLAYIEEERVIPIVGPASSTVVVDGRSISVDAFVAERLTSRLGLPPDALPPAPNLNEVVSLYLHRHGRREALYPRIRSIVHEAAFTPPKVLRQLAEIRHFNLFVTTAFDPLLETAINEARFGGAVRTQTIAYAPNNVRDLETSKRTLIDPTVYYLFGKLSAFPSSTISDEDLLEFLYGLQSESRRPERLLDELENNHLLIVGGNFSDWVARIFLRTAKRRRLSDPRDVLEILADDRSGKDPGLVAFFANFSPRTKIFHAGAEAFVETLSRRWHERFGTRDGLETAQRERASRDMPNGAIFISYAREDLAVVRALPADPASAQAHRGPVVTVDTTEAAAPVVDTARPWPGLDTFTEALSPFFFGRNAEADELFRRVRRDVATLLFGQSGLGKTSLLQAGLFPRLRWADFLPILIRLDHSPGAPPLAAQVKAAIERRVAAADPSEVTPIGAEESLWGYFHRADRRLADYARKQIVPHVRPVRGNFHLELGGRRQARHQPGFSRRTRRTGREPAARGTRTGDRVRPGSCRKLPVRSPGLPDRVGIARGFPCLARQLAQPRAVARLQPLSVAADERTSGPRRDPEPGARAGGARRSAGDHSLHRSSQRRGRLWHRGRRGGGI